MTQARLHLTDEMFASASRVLLESGALSAETFRFPSGVDVIVGHSRQERIEVPRAIPVGLDDECALLERHLDRRVVPEAEVIGEGLGNADGQAVAPFLDV